MPSTPLRELPESSCGEALIRRKETPCGDTIQRALARRPAPSSRSDDSEKCASRSFQAVTRRFSGHPSVVKWELVASIPDLMLTRRNHALSCRNDAADSP